MALAWVVSPAGSETEQCHLLPLAPHTFTFHQSRCDRVVAGSSSLLERGARRHSWVGVAAARIRAQAADVWRL